jgi:hypothetical protein
VGCIRLTNDEVDQAANEAANEADQAANEADEAVNEADEAANEAANEAAFPLPRIPPQVRIITPQFLAAKAAKAASNRNRLQ